MVTNFAFSVSSISDIKDNFLTSLTNEFSAFFYLKPEFEYSAKLSSSVAEDNPGRIYLFEFDFFFCFAEDVNHFLCKGEVYYSEKTEKYYFSCVIEEI